MVHHKKSHSNFLNSNQSQHMNSLKTFINGGITPSELFANHPYSAQHHTMNIQAPPFIGNQSISSSVQLLKQQVLHNSSLAKPIRRAPSPANTAPYHQAGSFANFGGIGGTQIQPQLAGMSLTGGTSGSNFKKASLPVGKARTTQNSPKGSQSKQNKNIRDLLLMVQPGAQESAGKTKGVIKYFNH